MSADPAIMPDDSAMSQDHTITEGQQTDPMFQQTPENDVPVPSEEDFLPLNAEEATVLVISFLKRMRKRIVSPKKAVLNDGVFTVDVELKRALATVQIDRETREIVEYSIEEREIELGLPALPVRRIAIILASVIATVIGMMFFSFYSVNEGTIISTVSNDFFILGAGLIVVVGVAYYIWRRRQE